MIAESTTMIGELETSLGVPTFALFANWRGEYSVDADEQAGRLLTSMFVERLRQERADEIALILAARGGYPAFADGVLRTLGQLEVRLQVVVPCRVDGSVGLLAAAGDNITLHPQAGIGAVDRGLCVVPREHLDASLFPYAPVDPAEFARLEQGEETAVARLAFDRLVRREQRRMAGRVMDSVAPDSDGSDWLLETSLGRGLTIGVHQLRQAGVEARVAPVPLAEQLEELMEWAGDTLSLFRDPDERFEVSDTVADEVEFEPAEMVPAAAIVGTQGVWLHELDTGSPDPHAPRLLGDWRRWDPEGQNRDNDATGGTE